MRRLRDFGASFVLMLMLWLMLARGDPGTLWFGVPAAALGTAASMRLSCGRGLRVLWGLPAFIPFFVFESLKGGIDVTRRVLHPRMSFDPVIVSFPMRLHEGPASAFFRGVVGLFPGTLCAGLEEGRLIVHALDGDLPVLQDLERIEERVGRLFGEEIARQAEPSDRP